MFVLNIYISLLHLSEMNYSLFFLSIVPQQSYTIFNLTCNFLSQIFLFLFASTLFILLFLFSPQGKVDIFHSLLLPWFLQIHQRTVPALRLEKILLPPSCFLMMLYLVCFLHSDPTVSSHHIFLHSSSPRFSFQSSSFKRQPQRPRPCALNPNAQRVRCREIPPPPPPPITPQPYNHHMWRMQRQGGGRDKTLHPWELVCCKHKQQASCRKGIRSSMSPIPGSAQLACTAEPNPCTQSDCMERGVCVCVCVDWCGEGRCPTLIQKFAL